MKDKPKDRDFKGVWIPRELYLNKELSWSEKILLVEIDSLDKDPEKGCFASNQYLAEFLGLSPGRVANMISDLRHRGHIQQLFFDGRNRGIRSSFHSPNLHKNVKVKLHENVNEPSRKRESEPSRKREHIKTTKESLVIQDKERVGPTAADFGTPQHSPPPIFNHPVLAAIREISKHSPPREVWQDLVDLLGADFDRARLEICFRTWRLRGFRATNFEWATDWYVNGIRSRTAGNGKGTRPASADVGRSTGMPAEVELYEPEPMSAEKRKRALAAYRTWLEHHGREYIESFRDNHTAEDWTWLMTNLEAAAEAA